jgi:hypothetical protein
MNRSVLPVIEDLENRQLLSAAIGSKLNIGDVGTYIGTAIIRTSLKGHVRKTGITLSITAHDTKNDHITGTIKVGGKLTFAVTGSLRNGGSTLSFAFSKTKVASGIFSGKVRKHLHVAEGRITLTFAKFSTNAVLDLIPSATQPTGGTGSTGVAATNPPTTLPFPGGTTTGTGNTGGTLFG